MSDGLGLLLVLSSVAALLAVVALLARNSSIRRFVGRSYTRGVLVVLEREVDPRALYFVGTVEGRDLELIRRGVDATDRRVFVWMTQEGRAGDPGRALLMDALHEHVNEWTEEWDGELHDEVRDAIRAKLASQGVRLGALQLAADVPLDADARARRAWWVCWVEYEGVAGELCCDGLEFFLDSQAAGLWSLRTRERTRYTSREVANDPDFRLICHAAKAPSDDLLGGQLKETKQLSVAEMAQPPP